MPWSHLTSHCLVSLYHTSPVTNIGDEWIVVRWGVRNVTVLAFGCIWSCLICNMVKINSPLFIGGWMENQLPGWTHDSVRRNKIIFILITLTEAKETKKQGSRSCSYTCLKLTTRQMMTLVRITVTAVRIRVVRLVVSPTSSTRNAATFNLMNDTFCTNPSCLQYCATIGLWWSKSAVSFG